MTRTYGAVIAAAGKSSRMEQFKPMLPFGDSTIIGTIMTKLRGACISRFSIVLGREADKLRRAVEAPDVSFTLNAEYETTDMLHSVKLGLREMHGMCDYLFFTPADTPLFQQESLEKMKSMAQNSEYDIIIPVHRGLRGHPILLKSSAVPIILKYSGERGLAGAIDNSGFSVKLLECGDFGVLPDADYKGDYALMRLLNGDGLPEGVVRHGRAVAKLTIALAAALNARGRTLDTGLAEAAALVHDCARDLPRHEERGAEMLIAIGRDDLAEIVRWHMLPAPSMCVEISEITLVYLADKLVDEDSPVTLEERFLRKFNQYADPAVQAAINEKYEIARCVKELFEDALGYEIDASQILEKYYETEIK